MGVGAPGCGRRALCDPPLSLIAWARDRHGDHLEGPGNDRYAGPSRRGVAPLIDVALVALITARTSGFWFILGAVAVAFFFTRAKKKKKEGTSNVLRFFLRCVGSWLCP